MSAVYGAGALNQARRGNVIGLWAVSLNAEPETVSVLAKFLSAKERAHALRFRFPHLTRRYTVGRAALRVLLAAHLDTRPAAIEFDEGHAGKLHLCDSDLEFNVSHCDELAIYGIGWGVEIGIDIERIRNVPDLESIARCYFAPAEWAALVLTPASLRTRAFFNCWTRKESYLKAIGEGLHAPLQAFEVTLRPEDEAAIRHIGGDEAEASHWSLCHLEPEPEFVGALAVRTRSVMLQPWHRLRSADELLGRRIVDDIVSGAGAGMS